MLLVAMPTAATTNVVVASTVVVAALLLLRWRRRSRVSPPNSPPTAALLKAMEDVPLQPLQPPAVHLSRTPSRVSLAEGQSRFGLDIGGSLLKLTYLELDGSHDDILKSLQVLDQVVSRPGSKRPSRNFDAAMAARVGAMNGCADEDDDGPPVAVLSSQPTSPTRRTRGVLDPSLTVNVPALGGKLCACCASNAARCRPPQHPRESPMQQASHRPTTPLRAAPRLHRLCALCDLERRACGGGVATASHH